MQSKWVLRKRILKDNALFSHGPILEEKWIEWGQPAPIAPDGHSWIYTDEEKEGKPLG